MTDAELRDAAVAALKATTVSYPKWLSTTYKDRSQTKWGQAFALLDQIAAPVPAPAFGAKLAPIPDVPAWPSVTVTDWPGLRDAVASGNKVVKVRGLIPIPEDWKWTAPVCVVAETPQVDGFTGGAVKLNGPSQQLRGLRITYGAHDGVKIGDGAQAANAVVDGCLIEMMQEQGILFGGNGCIGYWLTRNLIRRVGLGNSPYPHDDARQGHGIYVGGPTVNGWILANDIEANAYGIHLYPKPDGTVVAGNTIRPSRLGQAALLLYGASNTRLVGNLSLGGSLFQVTASSAATTVANDNVGVGGPLSVTDYTIPPGARNQIVATQTAADAVRVQDTDWLPAFTRTGTRTVAEVGA